MNKSYSFRSRYDEHIHKFYLEQRSFFWTENEIDFTRDINDWNELSEDQRNFLKNVLTFFLNSDGLVCENIQRRFSQDIQKIKGAEYFYNIQITIENIHEIVYDKFVQVYIKDEEIYKLNNRINIDPVINKKISWIEKWLNSNESFGIRLIAFAIVEGVFFTGSFASIFYLKHNGKMNGLAQANELIARDEQIHCHFACFLYRNKLEDKVQESKAHQIVKEAVEIEKEFYNKSLNVEIIGLNSSDMNLYIQYTADNILSLLGFKKLYFVKSPFEFMENIELNRKTNFFERKATEYIRVERKDIDFENL